MRVPPGSKPKVGSSRWQRVSRILRSRAAVYADAICERVVWALRVLAPADRAQRRFAWARPKGKGGHDGYNGWETACERTGDEMLKEMERERLTEDLLSRLLEADTSEAYLAQAETVNFALKDYLSELLAARGLNRSQLARMSCVSSPQLYRCFEGKGKPGRDGALRIAFALECNFAQTQRLLRLSGLSILWPKDARDAIIIWCIEHGYTREECDDELYRLGERGILKVTGDLR